MSKIKERKKWIIAGLVIALAIGAWTVSWMSKRNLTVPGLSDEEKATVSYAVCYCGGFGPRRLTYEEDREALDALVDMVAGPYRYRGKYSTESSVGGGPSSITLYGADGRELWKIQYMGSRIAVPTRNAQKYRLYRNLQADLSFDSFEAYLQDHGVYL